MLRPTFRNLHLQLNAVSGTEYGVTLRSLTIALDSPTFDVFSIKPSVRKLFANALFVASNSSTISNISFTNACDIAPMRDQMGVKAAQTCNAGTSARRKPAVPR